MTRFRKPAAIAEYLVNGKTAHGQSKNDLRAPCDRMIYSINTEKKYKSCIKLFIAWCIDNQYRTSHICEATAFDFLQANADRLRQKTLDGYRQAIALTYNLKLSYVSSQVDTVLAHRAYTNEQIAFLQKYADEALSISIQIAASAGLRAHELDTLSRLDELDESNREWRADRFFGMNDSTKFVVHGKGGLRRQVCIPNDLVNLLESFRLPIEIKIKQRGIYYTKRYGIIGGHQFSQQFSRLSQKEFGWSTGAHGLRHTYAQARMMFLQNNGYTWEDALEIVSQELGHFSTTNTLTYMR